ncbi:hypothetical protein GGP90_000886 [Salinibacter ruber]|nr:hypothetical protein [Salinibacter ruber]MCS3752047.1 hypothetical protein [Salinibacter ruber]MCS3756123.1 hypothetical protein [Salinibacter ruber]
MFFSLSASIVLQALLATLSFLLSVGVAAG